jgi:hypothetical protein
MERRMMIILEYIREQSYTSILKKVKACHGSGGDEEVD